MAPVSMDTVVSTNGDTTTTATTSVTNKDSKHSLDVSGSNNNNNTTSDDTTTDANANTNANTNGPYKKQKIHENFNKNHKQKQRKYKQKKNIESTSPLGVLAFEISELIQEQGLTEEQIMNPINDILNNRVDPLIYHRIVNDVKVLKLTSNGDSLALVSNPTDISKKQVIIVPFAIPGDIVSVKVYKTHPTYCESDLLHITTPANERNDSLINCKYFGVCSGCQYQELEYETQLEIKRTVIANAYKFFASNITTQTPAISDTEPSPLQYSYRTKLTPHFDLPRRGIVEKRPNLGFGAKLKRNFRSKNDNDGNNIHEHDGNSIIDIEECSIGTPVINRGIQLERQKFESTFQNYKKGATILLRENTSLLDQPLVGQLETPMIEEDQQHQKTYVTNSRQIVQELINGFKFEFSAGEFFQNNNSILPRVIEYVSENLQLADSQDENYLIDAYCGSGLFSITTAHSVTKSIGVEISADSVKFAKRNAELNNITNCEFLAGKAEAIFADIKLPRDKTSIILDPPRKGCDDVFLKQLSEFKPIKIIYISCNVHSQARDLDFFLTQTNNGGNYKIESIKGFDFFPQTHHVESIAVLSLI